MCTSTFVTLHPVTDLSLCNTKSNPHIPFLKVFYTNFCYCPLFFQKITQKLFWQSICLASVLYILFDKRIKHYFHHLNYMNSRHNLCDLSCLSFHQIQSFLGSWQNMRSEFSLEVPCKKTVLVEEA
jgi:hypothetical protein